MYVNAWKETFERAELQGKPVLFTPNRVLPETVPEKWFRYELRSRGRDFEVPRYLEKEVGRLRRYGAVAGAFRPEPRQAEHRGRFREASRSHDRF